MCGHRQISIPCLHGGSIRRHTVGFAAAVEFRVIVARGQVRELQLGRLKSWGWVPCWSRVSGRFRLRRPNSWKQKELSKNA